MPVEFVVTYPGDYTRLAETLDALKAERRALRKLHAFAVKHADLAEDAVDAVRNRPYAASGVVAAIALFIAFAPADKSSSRTATPRGIRRSS